MIKRVFVILVITSLLLTSCMKQNDNEIPIDTQKIVTPNDNQVTVYQTEPDYSNFIRFNGIVYKYTILEIGRNISINDLDEIFNYVKYKLRNNPTALKLYDLDGVAAYIEPGTPVYTIKGYASSFRLAANLDGKLRCYEATDNPKAKTGADLLDIKDKVKYISINSYADVKAEIATIKGINEVDSIVEMILSAPIKDEFVATKGNLYQIIFHLNDGTVSRRIYNMGSNKLQNILLPDQFRIKIKDVLSDN